MAPVRLRFVASGLIIEKVRSIAICYPLQEIGVLEVAGCIARRAGLVKGPKSRAPGMFAIGRPGYLVSFFA
jgi:hypothetical protein